MKKVILLLVFISCTRLTAQLTVTITSQNGNYSLTCNSPTNVLIASSNYTGASVIYVWSVPMAGSVNGSTLSATASGVYTLSATAGSLTSVQTVTLFPESTGIFYNVSSPQNFILGCNTHSTVQIALTTTATTVFGYTLLAPGSSSILPAGPWTSSPNFTMASAGTWTIISWDSLSHCVTKIPLTVLSNTVQPDISVSAATKTLDCVTKSTVLQGLSLTSNVAYSWQFSGSNQFSFAALTVFSNSAAATNTLLGNYSLTVTDLNNGCSNSTVVSVYQNLFAPIASIFSTGNMLVACEGTSLHLFNSSFSGIPSNVSFIPSAIIGLEWHGPSPQASLSISSTYTAGTTGTYTLIAKDLSNGCKSKATLDLSFKDCTGNYEIKNVEKPFMVFPNPGKDLFSIYKTNGDTETILKIYNTQGKLVVNKTLLLGSNYIDLSNEVSGLYFFYFHHQNGTTSVSKIIKE